MIIDQFDLPTLEEIEWARERMKTLISREIARLESDGVNYARASIDPRTSDAKRKQFEERASAACRKAVAIRSWLGACGLAGKFGALPDAAHV
jgi:hypothetical protein